jgi:hypothetical protein
MSRRPAGTPARLAFTKEDVLADLGAVLLGNACQIVLSTGSGELAEKYIGISLDEFSLGSMPGSWETDIEAIDLERFHLAGQITSAYDFAFQTGDVTTRTTFNEDDWNDLEIFVAGASRCSFGCEPTPLADENSNLRRALDMALARMNLRHGASLTIRQLALLADIGETAVRTSLSADGIRTEGKPAQLSAEIADGWLNKRRGFVPTLEPEDVEDRTVQSTSVLLQNLPFANALTEIIELRNIDKASVAKDTGLDVAWLGSLMTGETENCDLDALQRLAVYLDTDVPLFVSRAVEATLRAKAMA